MSTKAKASEAPQAAEKKVVLQGLAQITTGYCVFAPDQVLTPDQLNSVSNYFEDQTRLTRVKLVGVGIVCGLCVSLSNNVVTVTRGAGVTTDGDLLYFAADMRFDQMKPHDESNPEYKPFAPSKGHIYQLVQSAANDPRATDIGEFASTDESLKASGTKIEDLVAVLFMESYVKANNVCSSDHCDNTGGDFINTVKVLLIEKAAASALLKTVATPADVFASFEEVVVERPLFGSTMQTPAALAGAYRTVCDRILASLLTQLTRIYARCSSFLDGAVPAKSADAWSKQLKSIQAANKSGVGIQYYYDFLKDLAETYNQFRALLFDERTLCCPPTDLFPKHLLLGNLKPGSNPDENRTAFYPTPVTSRTSEALEHLRFLARKLDTLIRTFQAPAVTSTIRVTPSYTEERHLEERAIPYYYKVSETSPVLKSWSFALNQRGMDAWNYSYNAALYGAQGGAANPLTSQIGRFTFFRIEGHLGQDVTTAMNAIKAEIASKNLPFAVRAVLLGSDRKKIAVKPDIRYSDLHRFHYVLRQDTVNHLGKVSAFSSDFTGKVTSAVGSGVINDTADDSDAGTVTQFVTTQHETIARSSTSAQGVLNRSYLSYKSDPSWKTHASTTMQAAGAVKSGLTKVVKTDFNTPVDSLISNSHILWLDWLDKVIQQKDDRADDKLLFTQFLADHPGIEHFAGVRRGGTFVLVYDASKKVVADFALDYVCCDEAEDQPVEPPLTDPDWRPGKIFTDGIKINPSIEKYFKGKLDTYVKDVIDPKINFQKDYLKTFQEVTDVFSKLKTDVKIGATISGTKYTDKFLDAAAEENRAKQRQVEALNEKASDPGQPAEKRELYSRQAKDLQAELGKSAQTIAKFVSDSGMDLTAGSEGHSAMLEASKSVDMISDTTTRDSVSAGFSELARTSSSAVFGSFVGGMIRR